ncbi:ATP-binding cassette domain-containing protein [Robertmurraya kyonggiensis]|uniref:ABC transporter ATP-binding protein n=1 Tax=Robertmurraya kyonggiensis TaxID=1037680 RepID=A0A4U1D9K3_9BACI|nr:ABC transporter ATP-binding protein [Robertmurraya kyonggiensis]TKC19114.1 ABC transporter ATP-binding protein [Robertmurraya kyonggiensis]
MKEYNLKSLIIKMLKPNIAKLIFAIISSIFRSSILLLPPLVTMRIIDEIIPSFSLNKIVTYGSLLIIIPIIILLLYTLDAYLNKFVLDIAAEIRSEIFKGILYKDIGWHKQSNKSELLDKVVNSSSTVGEFYFLTISNIIWFTTTIAVGIFLMAQINLKITTIVFLFTLLQILFVKFFKKKQQEIEKELLNIRIELTDTLNQGIIFNDYFKVSKRRKYEIEKIENIEKKREKSNLKSIFINFLVANIGQIFKILSIFIIYFLGESLMKNSTLTIGGLVALTSYYSWISPVVLKYQEWIMNLFRALTNFRRINEIYFPTKKYEKGYIPDNNGLIKLQLKDISFAYKNSNKDLRNINISLSQGETIIIRGQSGVGKTTLTQLIMRQIEPDNGMILINGIPHTKINKEWFHKNVVCVLQTNDILKTSLLNNINYNSESISMLETQRIIEATKLHSLINSLGNGLLWEYGSDSRELSDGEKRRINIARAMMSTPKIIILDEPTAGLDNIIKQELMMNIRNYFKNSIKIIITHDEEIVNPTDKIYFITDNSSYNLERKDIKQWN